MMISLIGRKRMTFKSRWHNVLGFTIIEVMLVMVILVIITGLAAPNFSNTYAGIQLKVTTDDIAYLMRYAQSRAVARGNEIRIEFDSSLRVYWITEEEQSDTYASDKMFNRITGRLGKKNKIPEMLNLEIEKPSIHFFPDGTIEKVLFNVCLKEQCRIISTKEQRGAVRVYEAE